MADTQAVQRDAASTAAGLLALQQGASIIRTHNVAMMQQAVALWQQLVAYDIDNNNKSASTSTNSSNSLNVSSSSSSSSINTNTNNSSKM